jgi:A/G-specific adenine glycosylase
MLSGAALTRFRKKLLAWFTEFQRDLPWRHTKDPYRIWLSEIMLQQTRVAAVIPYYHRFLEAFPEVRALAEAPEEEVLRQWAGLGYYSRARNLQNAARQIVAEHNAKFPGTPEKALALSGIGTYTAAAILSIAYGKKMAVLDGNVARVIARLGAIRGDMRSGSRWQQMQEIADKLLAPQAPGDWNQAMMELGATICTPRSPHCLLCPIEEFCETRKLGLADVIPEKKKKRATIEITLAAVVLLDEHRRTLLLRQPKTDAKPAAGHDVAALLSRMWHFPTIYVTENPAKELRAFVASAIFAGRTLPGKLQALPKVRHAVTYRQITLLPFRLEVRKLPRFAEGKVLPLADLFSVPVSNLTRKIAKVAVTTRISRTSASAKESAFCFTAVAEKRPI